jgi:hypothetical protein
MNLTPGLRLRSVVCETVVIVIRGSSTEAAELTCGGHPMAPIDASPTPEAEPVPGMDGGTVMGKRYTLVGNQDIELLVTRAGAGTLASGTTPLVQKEARLLPSSD